jgi:hypothetical protein
MNPNPPLLQSDRGPCGGPEPKGFQKRVPLGQLLVCSWQIDFLEKSTRPDISYVTHQVARFSEDPKASHGKAIEHIVKYLRDTHNDGIILCLSRTSHLRFLPTWILSEIGIE